MASKVNTLARAAFRGLAVILLTTLLVLALLGAVTVVLVLAGAMLLALSYFVLRDKVRFRRGTRADVNLDKDLLRVVATECAARGVRARAADMKGHLCT